VKSWLIGKDSDAGRDWGQEEKGMTEDEMAGWHHRLNGRESEWTLGVCDGQGGLVCCDSWGRKESDMTEWLNWTELNHKIYTNMKILNLSKVMHTHAHTHTHTHLWTMNSTIRPWWAVSVVNCDLKKLTTNGFLVVLIVFTMIYCKPWITW